MPYGILTLLHVSRQFVKLKECALGQWPTLL